MKEKRHTIHTACLEIGSANEVYDKGHIGKDRYDGGADSHPEGFTVGETIVKSVAHAKDDESDDVYSIYNQVNTCLCSNRGTNRGWTETQYIILSFSGPASQETLG